MRVELYCKAGVGAYFSSLCSCSPTAKWTLALGWVWITLFLCKQKSWLTRTKRHPSCFVVFFFLNRGFKQIWGDRVEAVAFFFVCVRMFCLEGFTGSWAISQVWVLVIVNRACSAMCGWMCPCYSLTKKRLMTCRGWSRVTLCPIGLAVHGLSSLLPSTMWMYVWLQITFRNQNVDNAGYLARSTFRNSFFSLSSIFFLFTSHAHVFANPPSSVLSCFVSFSPSTRGRRLFQPAPSVGMWK